MKYLKYRTQFLNEAFDAKSLSKTMGWLSKSGLKPGDFLKDLKQLCESNDITLSNIEDSFFKVNVRRKEALSQKPEEVHNPTGWGYVKFWFSAKEGYTGYTITSKNEVKKTNSRNSNQNRPFDENDIENVIKLGYEKGELKTVKDYSKLKTGDLAFIKINDQLTVGRIFVSHSSRGNLRSIYFIGDSLTWFIANENFEKATDHDDLHLYTKSDEPIHVYGSSSKEHEGVDFLSFNLANEKGSRYLYRIDSSSRDYEVKKNRGYSIDKESLDNSDFAIIFYLDDFLAHYEDSLKSIRKGRAEARKDAIALMTNDEIKKINVQNRIEELVKRFNISQDINNLTNLKTITLSILMDDWALFNIFYGYNNSIIYRIYDFFNIVDRQGSYSDEEYNKYLNERLSSVRNEYRDLLNTKTNRISRFKVNYNKILNSNSELVVDFIKEFMRLSIKLKDKIRSKNINSLYDASIIFNRLRDIVDPPNDSLRFPYYIRDSFSYFNREDSDTAYHYMNEYRPEDKARCDKAMAFIERQIDQL